MNEPTPKVGQAPGAESSRRNFFKEAALTLAVFLLPASSFAQEPTAKIESNPDNPLNISAFSDGASIRQDLAPSKIPFQSIMEKDGTIYLDAARNEIIAFQVNIWSGQDAIKDLKVSLSDLETKGSNKKLRYKAPSDNPSDYVGREVSIYSLNYMPIVERSNADWVVTEESAPKGFKGNQAVQLVPENASKGGLDKGLSVKAKENQSIWIEVFTPKNMPAGKYTGDITISIDGKSHEIPVELQLYDLTLPDENPFVAMAYYESGEVMSRHGKDLSERYRQMAHRYGLELVEAVSPEEVRRVTRDPSGSRWNGDLYTKKYGYAGPSEGMADRVVPRSFYEIDEGEDWSDPAVAKKLGTEWMKLLELPPFKREDRITFLYGADEPDLSDLSVRKYLQKLGESIDSAGEIASKLPLFVTATPEDPKFPIDIFCAHSQSFNREFVAAAHTHGKKVWTYNGGRPQTGAGMATDAPATDPRVIMLGVNERGVEGYFYWHSNQWSWWFRKQGTPHEDGKLNVWKNSITFDNRVKFGKPFKWGGAINGDGVMLYPGQDHAFPEEDRGIAGPIAGIQLANLRRGLFDAKLFNLAKQHGLGAEVQRTLNRLVPRIYEEAGKTVSFPETPEPFEQERVRILKLLEEKLASDKSD